jgi:hypothetical protein
VVNFVNKIVCERAVVSDSFFLSGESALIAGACLCSQEPQGSGFREWSVVHSI